MDKLWTLYLYKLLRKLRLTGVRRSIVHATSKLESGTSFVHSTLAKHSFCGYDCDVAHADIGAFTSIANGVVIGGGRHPMEWVGMSPVFYAGRDSVKAKFSRFERGPLQRVMIGHDVWIGRNAIVLAGVIVGHGAVIGAGAIVTKDVPPYAIVAGNPARLIRHRFAPDIIERLLRAKWWDIEESRLADLATDIRDVEAFLRRIER